MWRREISLCERWKLRRWVEAVWRKKRLQGCIRRINYTLQRFAYCLKNVRLHIPIDYQWKCKRLSCVIVAIGRSIDQIYLYFTFRDTKFGEAHGQAQSLQYLIIRIQTMTPPWRHHPVASWCRWYIHLSPVILWPDHQILARFLLHLDQLIASLSLSQHTRVKRNVCKVCISHDQKLGLTKLHHGNAPTDGKCFLTRWHDIWLNFPKSRKDYIFHIYSRKW